MSEEASAEFRAEADAVAARDAWISTGRISRRTSSCHARSSSSRSTTRNAWSCDECSGALSRGRCRWSDVWWAWKPWPARRHEIDSRSATATTSSDSARRTKRRGGCAAVAELVPQAPSLQSAALMNVVVYVSDALRADHLGCYGARFLNTKTIDELAAGGIRFDQAISAAPWTAPSMTSMVTGLYAHRHGYLHWDAALDPTTETLFRALGAHGYDVGTFVFDTNYLFKEMPEANVLGTSETLDGAIAWLRREARQAVPPLLPQLGDAHALRRSSTRSARTGSRRRRRSSAGIQGDSASALEATREAYRQGGRAPVGGARRVACSRSSRRSGCARTPCSRSSPTTASRGASASSTRATSRASTTCTARRSTTRSCTCR